MAKIVIHMAPRMNQADLLDVVQMDYPAGSRVIAGRCGPREPSTRYRSHQGTAAHQGTATHQATVICGAIARQIAPRKVWIFLSVIFLMTLGCKRQDTPVIAAIPRTTGIALWEPVREGAIAASGSNASIYWNAPTREDDVEGQIALLNREIDREGVEGIILAADHSLALVTPIRRGLAKGIPIVVISSPLAIPAGGKLAFILNDEEEGGRLAANRVGEILHGKGSVAMLGIDPDSVGAMARAGSFENNLAHSYPDIKIVEKRFGTYNLPHEQEVAAETLRAFPQLQVILSLTSTTTRGAYFALADSNKAGAVKLVGFDQDIAFDSVQEGKIDSVIVEDTYQMGYQAVGMILAELKKQPVQSVTKLKPILVTRDNLGLPQVQQVLSFNWRLVH